MNNFINISGRQSGRTSRMLIKALDLVKKGHMVYVLCTPESINHLRKQATDLYDSMGVENIVGVHVKLETLKSLGEENVDLHHLKLKYSHPNCRLLADHFFYEYYFAHIINGYHEWDAIHYPEH